MSVNAREEEFESVELFGKNPPKHSVADFEVIRIERTNIKCTPCQGQFGF